VDQEGGSPGGSRWCPNCGAEYLAHVSSCADCRVPLDPMPPGPVDHETVAYDLADWSEGQRKAVELLLAGASISFAWDNATDLVVSRSVEAAVDELLDDVEHQPGTPEDEQSAVRPTRPWFPTRPTDTLEELATIGQRFLARVVDQLLLIVSFQVVLLVFADEAPRRGGPDGTFFWAGMAWFFVYEVTLTAIWGQTLGKRALRIRIVGPDGATPDWNRAARRAGLPAALGAIPFIGGLLGLGVVLRAVAVPDRRGYHDLFADTKVVRNGLQNT
jgi:uncharacterized RDD family membrane protein YckC